MTWNESSDEVLDFSREPGFRCIVNFGAEKVAVDADAVIASSIPLEAQGKTRPGRLVASLNVDHTATR